MAPPKLRQHLKDALFLLLGVCMAGIGLKGFLLPNGFLDGGAMGMALLGQIVTGVDLSVLIVAVNLPFILMAVRQISKRFAVKSAVAIVVLAVLVHDLHIPAFTDDKLLIAVFGGFFLGAGIGLSIRGGGVIDGTEVMAIAVSRRSSLSVGDFIALFNIVLFCLAALMLDFETAMYSMLTYIAASKTIDFILNGIEEYIGVMIVSDLSDDIKRKITDDLRYGVTVFKSDGGYRQAGFNSSKKNVLFCVITRLEMARLTREIAAIDAKAFIVQYPVKDAKGGMIRRRPLH